MEAMVMPFSVSDSKELRRLQAGTTIDFVLEDRNGNPYATKIKIREFQSMELDPTAARRLKGVEAALTSTGPKAVAVGQEVPDFTLTDQNRREVSFSQLKGKVVAITFMYTRCPFPTYCVRLSDNLARLQKRFQGRIGRDLILLSIVIDAAHDDPATLKKYSRKWNADPVGWHFLTGPSDRIQSICRYFDMNYYPDEGLYIHSFHTAVVDRHGRMVANLEGNEFTAQQLGDLVDSVLNRSQQ
jgi:protein SCO1/2